MKTIINWPPMPPGTYKDPGRVSCPLVRTCLPPTRPESGGASGFGAEEPHGSTRPRSCAGVSPPVDLSAADQGRALGDPSVPRLDRRRKPALSTVGAIYTKITDAEVITRTVLHADFDRVDVREIRRGLRPHDRRVPVLRPAWRRWLRGAVLLTSPPIPV